MNKQKNPNKYLLTQSLIGSWQFSIGECGDFEEFLRTLRREKSPPNEAMLEGQRFENLVEAFAQGNEIDDSEKWSAVVREIGEEVKGSQYQVKVSRDLTIDGMTFVLFGIIDFLKAGIIYDTKFSKTYASHYNVNKYFTSPQAPFYFYCLPEAYKFKFLISNGKEVYREIYTPDLFPPIESIIKPFIQFLKNQNLLDVYKQQWKSKY